MPCLNSQVLSVGRRAQLAAARQGQSGQIIQQRLGAGSLREEWLKDAEGRGEKFACTCTAAGNKKAAEAAIVVVGTLRIGAGEGTRTLTPKAQEPKSCASTNFATPAGGD